MNQVPVIVIRGSSSDRAGAPSRSLPHLALFSRCVRVRARTTSVAVATHHPYAPPPSLDLFLLLPLLAVHATTTSACLLLPHAFSHCVHVRATTTSAAASGDAPHSLPALLDPFLLPHPLLTIRNCAPEANASKGSGRSFALLGLGPSPGALPTSSFTARDFC